MHLEYVVRSSYPRCDDARGPSVVPEIEVIHGATLETLSIDSQRSRRNHERPYHPYRRCVPSFARLH